MIVTLGSVTSNIVKEMLGCTTRFVNPKNKPQTKKKKALSVKNKQKSNLCPGIWRWLDQAAVDYTNWYEGVEMRNSYGSIRASDGGWTTGSGYHDRGYICKTPKGEIIILFELNGQECVTHCTDS